MAIQNPVFGDSSILNTDISQTYRLIPDGYENINLIITDATIIAIFVFYLLIIYFFRHLILQPFKTILYKNHFRHIMDENSLLFRHFINTVTFLGYIEVGLISLKTYSLSGLDNKFASLAIAIMLVIIYLYRAIAHRIIAALGGAKSFMNEFMFLNNITFAAMVITVTPLVLAIGIIDYSNMYTATVSAAIILVFFQLTYIIVTLNFFISKKVSILQWFLYLCTVEILPISYFLLLAIRSL